MEGSVSIASGSTDMRFQSLEEWTQEQNELNAQIAVEAAKSGISAVPTPFGKKKAKRVIDISALSLEREAIEETGYDNWVGKLMRKEPCYVSTSTFLC